MTRRVIVIVLCIVAILAVWHFSAISGSDQTMVAESPVAAPVNTITIGWVGDMVPSTDIAYNLTVLNNVSADLEATDLMIGNLDGTFAHSNRVSICDTNSSCYAFKGDSSFADTLKAAGFDFINLINSHSLDYGTAGLKDTEAELNRVGLPYIAPDKTTTSITIKGIKIGIMGVSSIPSANITNYAYIVQTVQALKKNNDIVVVIFDGGSADANKTTVSGGEEYDGSVDRGNVQAVAYTAINAGADLVLGDGPHVLRKVEWYNNKPIAYSLGNFVGGNGALATEGNLGLGGIFVTTFDDNRGNNGKVVPVSTSFISVLLAKDGTPSLDPTDASLKLLQSLSGGPIK